MKVLSKVFEISKMSIKVNLVYVAGFWGSIFSGLLQVIIIFSIWNAIYGSNDLINGFTKNQMITYIILTRILITLFGYGINLMISDLILTGNISMELLRPLDLQLALFSRRLGDFMIQALTIGVPLLILSVLLFGITAPLTVGHGFVFALSVFLAMTISFLIEYFSGLMTFYTTNGWGIQNLKMFIISFFSGSLLPLDFFPNSVKWVVDLLPFKNLAYTPAAIYLGILDGQKILTSIVGQLLWIIALVLFNGILFRVLIRKITVHGG